MQKYQQYYEEMVDQNKALFNVFMTIHDKYVSDQTKFQAEFNEVGGKILELAKIWEDKLCQKSEGGGYGKFSHNLVDKFRDLLKKDFAYIDFVGCR